MVFYENRCFVIKECGFDKEPLKICTSKPSLIVLSTDTSEKESDVKDKCFVPVDNEDYSTRTSLTFHLYNNTFHSSLDKDDLSISLKNNQTSDYIDFIPLTNETNDTNNETTSIEEDSLTKTFLNSLSYSHIPFITNNDDSETENKTIISFNNHDDENNLPNIGPKYNTNDYDDDVLPNSKIKKIISSASDLTKLKLSIADPQQIYSDLELQFSYKDRKTKFKIRLPTEPKKGSSVVGCALI